MPLKHLVMILACTIFAAALTIWVAVKFIGPASSDQNGWMVLIPVVLVVYGVWRGIEMLRMRRNDRGNS